jgi:DNA-binding XRE family transcriptional regulator
MNNDKISLGNTVKRSREKLGMTQSEVAESAGIDVRTVLNIENYRGNPKFEVLLAIIKTLKIDPRDIFNLDDKQSPAEIFQLKLIIDSCTAEEAAALIPIMEAVLDALRSSPKMKLV